MAMMKILDGSEWIYNINNFCVFLGIKSELEGPQLFMCASMRMNHETRQEEQQFMFPSWEREAEESFNAEYKSNSITAKREQ